MQESKKTIYFVRHGQTVGNVAEISQGPDDQLNKKGLMQAKFIAKRASELNFSQIISSDYARAKSTAQTISERTGKPLELSELFREFRRPSEFWGRVPKQDPEVLAGYTEMEQNFFKKTGAIVTKKTSLISSAVAKPLCSISLTIKQTGCWLLLTVISCAICLV